MKRSRLLVAYTSGVTLGGLALVARFLPQAFDPPAYRDPEFLLLAGAVLLGEFVRIRIFHGRETVMVTVGDPFTLAILFTFGLGPALLAKVVATVIEDVYRRQVWWKLLFNVAQFSMSLGAAYGILMYVTDFPGARGITEPATLGGVLLSSFIYFSVNMILVTTAIAIATDQSPLFAIRSGLKSRVINQGVLVGFAPIVVAALDQSLVLFPLMLIPVIVVYRSGMISHRHVQMAQQLTELYETTRMTNAQVGTRESVKELLERVCNMFSATGASIVFFAREGEEFPSETSIDLDRNTFAYMQPTTLNPTKGIWARAAAESKALMLASPIDNKNLQAHYASMGIKDVMVAPMVVEEQVTGVIRVFNRQGVSQTFTSEDLRLFETLANHASIAMENARLITQLEDSLAHLTEMNQLKDDFVASVSHELRTPLTSIRGYVKTMLRPDVEFDAADTKSFLETIDRQSNRLHRLIEDLLAVSRIESETDSSTLTMLSLKPLAEEVADELRTKAGAHTIEVTISDDLPSVHSDAGKVHQIVSNLVDNALKYSPDGGTVSVGAVPSGGGVTISVSDEGPGVPADLRDKIFDRFYQVDQSATRQVGGAGLGLYISRRMAEAIGGRVWLEKSDEEGSTFSLWIPLSIGLPLKHTEMTPFS
ncbi:MAG: hypothetical protein QOG04_1208 [Actinomycetota bacterium]|jgi:signal transduction histidine kinase|nr:hypothetical protein [Actinomycetota bacterium]